MREKKPTLTNISLKQFFTKHFFFFVIVAVAIFARFTQLTTIPILTHDEAKDAGLAPQSVLSGNQTDYFGFVAGINIIFYLLASVPHVLFSDPILKVRFFSAIFGVAAVALVYVLGNYLFSKKTGVIAGFLLSIYHVHLFFSRTEFLNIFDSFYSTLILLSFFSNWKTKTRASLITLATMLGFGLHFYSGLRAIIAIIFTFTLIRCLSIEGLKAKAQSLTLLVVFFLVGLGPTVVLLFTDRLTEFMATGTASTIFQSHSSSVLQKLFYNYGNSLLAYIKTPIDFHYNYGGPFLLPPFSLFFIFGVLMLCLKFHKGLNLLLLACLFGIPFFNSGILNFINNTHRLTSVVPIIILITSYGIATAGVFVARRIHSGAALGLTFAIVALFFYQNITLFFVHHVWEKALNINEFRAWEIQKIVHKENPHITKVFFIGSYSYPSFRSVPSLDYLTKEYDFADITTQEELRIAEDGTKASTLLYFILPDNLAGIPDTTTPLRQAVYYKNRYLFNTIQIKNHRNLLKNPSIP